MLDLNAIIRGLELIARPELFLAVACGMLIGIIIGGIPGITSSLSLAIMLPMTASLTPLTAIMFLMSAYSGSLVGGGIMAVLVNMPGTPGAVAATFDGYPMTCRGDYNEALGLQICASFLGGLWGWLLLLLFIKPMAQFSQLICTLDMFFLAIFIFVLIGVSQETSLIRSIFSGIIGLLLTSIGTVPGTELTRGTFGISELDKGLPIVLCIVGLFALPEVFNLILRESIAPHDGRQSYEMKRFFAGGLSILRHKWTVFKSGCIGIIVGLLPSAGAAVASLLSYSIAKRAAKPGQKFGKGEPDGLIAAEIANSASSGGAMASLFVLGIPGSGSAAVIFAGFLMHGITPGTGMFKSHSPLIYALIISGLLSMIIMGVLALLFAFHISRIVLVPSAILVPLLIVLMTVGAFSFRHQTFDVLILLCFGGVGYLLRRFEFSIVSLIIGLFLGKEFEKGLLAFSTALSENPFDIFAHPISVVLIILISLLLTFNFFKHSHHISNSRT